MFYLKYRPQKIRDLDSPEVRNQVTSIFNKKDVPHAFLLVGPKGVGKTSTARIIAKIVNCENNMFGSDPGTKGSADIEPCGECSSCTAIANGNSPDVFEMDAASNRKIDDIRELISKLGFSPIAGRYKVYIIDEVHMLTKEAFNALLKSLEEPPRSTIFILATTEQEMLPKTIISRCVPISFTRALSSNIKSMIERIQKDEKIKVSPEAIEYLTSNADGSFRDAAKILEQAQSKGEITLETLKNVLGHQWEQNTLLQMIADKDQAGAIAWIEETAQKGADFKALIAQLLNELHDYIVAKSIEQSQKDTYNLNLKEASKLVGLLQQAYSEVKFSPVQQLPLQIAVIEFCI